MDPDPGGPKTCGSGGFGSATVPGRRSSRLPTAPRPTPGPQWTAGEILAKYNTFFGILTYGTEQYARKAVLGYENSRIPRLSVGDPQIRIG
jgi:hypothetical protein